MLYRLNWGKHKVVSKGVTKVYAQGETIETDMELDKQFRIMHNAEWKFTALDSAPVNARPAIASVTRSPSKPVEGTPEQVPSTDIPPETVTETATVAVATAAVNDDPAFAKYGEDVSQEFEKAGSLGFQVRFDGERYRVLDSKAKVVNGIRKLDTSKSVRLFLKHYAPEV